MINWHILKALDESITKLEEEVNKLKWTSHYAKAPLPSFPRGGIDNTLIDTWQFAEWIGERYNFIGGEYGCWIGKQFETNDIERYKTTAQLYYYWKKEVNPDIIAVVNPIPKDPLIDTIKEGRWPNINKALNDLHETVKASGFYEESNRKKCSDCGTIFVSFGRCPECNPMG